MKESRSGFNEFELIDKFMKFSNDYNENKLIIISTWNIILAKNVKWSQTTVLLLVATDVALFHLLHSNHDYYYKFRISYHVTACNVLCDLI